ncbi:hypothetical protein [Robiginitalea myxolifaciens]|nr:hypothetical protein [Robiginitalea myxolifaciens]
MKLLCTAFFLLFFTSSFAQELACDRFKTGKFLMEDPNTGKNYITRTATTQIEDVPDLGIKVELNIRWEDECTFVLTLKKVLENTSGREVGDFELISKITETGEDYFLVSSRIEGMDLIMDRKFVVLE